MQAIVAARFGGPEVLELREVSAPVPGPGEVLIAVAATALNRADLLQRRGLYPPPAGASDILGLECAGTVTALGASVTELALGERVMALLPGGGYAEQVTAPTSVCLRVPERLTLRQAAAIPEAFLTAQEALFAVGRLAPGETVLIHAAAGGVGSAAVQLAVLAGARVLASAGNDEKCELARQLGAARCVSYRTEDFEAVVKTETAGRGVDVILDFVGARYAEQHVRCLADGGRQVVVGLLGGATANVDLGQVLRRRLSILGVVMRSRSTADKAAIVAEFRRRFLPALADGRLIPVLDSVLPLARAGEAHARMEHNENLGKIVLET